MEWTVVVLAVIIISGIYALVRVQQHRIVKLEAVTSSKFEKRNGDLDKLRQMCQAREKQDGR